MQLAIDRFLQDRWKKNQHFTLNYVQLSHISNISQIKQTVLMNIKSFVRKVFPCVIISTNTSYLDISTAMHIL